MTVASRLLYSRAGVIQGPLYRERKESYQYIQLAFTDESMILL